jgi:hypothetical protein
MKPTNSQDLTLVHALNKLLDKGVILNADIEISLSGINLINIRLSALIAGAATMIDYGLCDNKKISESTKPNTDLLVDSKT